MSWINDLEKYFRTPENERDCNTPPGVCPNCWGEQEYGDVVRDMYKDKQIDVNNHEEHHAFIQEFVVTHISGIKLKKTVDGYQCPTCHAVFEQENNCD